MALENDLRHAMQRDELRVQYQPVWSLVTGRITGFEALVRWNHPTQGPMQPGDFIPIAEATGLGPAPRRMGDAPRGGDAGAVE